jgi:metacaspase-1
MAQGVSIHIGLNKVDPDQYGGWDGQLAGCINDANSMKAIADGLGFTSQIITDDQATLANVAQTISNSANQLDSGDLLLVTYSGHGGQVPDANAPEEEDGLDETWVLYDKMMLDNQLYALWSQFKAGVRIFVLSDSCHSGTILRDMIMQQIAKTDAGAKGYRATPSSIIREKAIPAANQQQHITKFRDYYTAVQYLRADQSSISVSASVLLISGCQDNQTSADGDKNGLFTQNLLEVWDNGSFAGSYKQFYQAILNKMPPTQTPNYYNVGVADPNFEAQCPFTIDSISTTTTTSTSPTTSASDAVPTVSGPSTLDRETDDAPTFNVDRAGAPYYIFEIASDYSLFPSSEGRNDSNFYGSYADAGVSSRLTTSTFKLPDSTWQLLKAADKLYYRVGTTTSATDWDNYVTSTADDQASSAPSISISGVKALLPPKTTTRKAAVSVRSKVAKAS